jgi:transposase-like protein
MPRCRRRSFSADLKAQIVLEDLSGARSHTEAARHRKLEPELITCWYQFMIDRATLGDAAATSHARGLALTPFP